MGTPGTLDMADVEKLARRRHIDLWHKPVSVRAVCDGVNAELRRDPGSPPPEELWAGILDMVLVHLRADPGYYAGEHRDRSDELKPLGDRPDW
jgi:hypothetical protein